MIVKEDLLEAYKEAIRLKYEVEKTEIYSSFLIVPSRAKLRQLCVERLKNNSNVDDLKSFNLFFGFEFGVGALNKLQAQTDKFRPIETFLKRETDLTDIEGINIAAILVDFNPRPFNRFIKVDLNLPKEEKTAIKVIEKKEDYSVIDSSKADISKNNISHQPLKRGLNKKIGIGILSLIGILSVGYTTKDLFLAEKECMQWQENHYELVDCDVQGIGGMSTIEPIRKEILHLRQIEVCDTTTFFKEGKPIIWYCKVEGKPEFFNTHGVHPETGKALRPVSEYIVEKYVKFAK